MHMYMKTHVQIGCITCNHLSVSPKNVNTLHVYEQYRQKWTNYKILNNISILTCILKEYRHRYVYSQS